MAKVKVRVLVPHICGTAGDSKGLAEFEADHAAALIRADAAEAVEPKVEQATAAPGEKRTVTRKTKKA